MITRKHRTTYGRCIDSGMSSALKIATIFKMVYDITDEEALKLTMACADYYNETLFESKKKAKEQGMIVTEVDEEQEWETECEHKQEVDLGIHDDYLDRCN